MNNIQQQDEIKALGFKLCFKRCMNVKEAIKTSHIHHTLYPCIEHCSQKYKKVVKLVFNE